MVKRDRLEGSSLRILNSGVAAKFSRRPSQAQFLLRSTLPIPAKKMSISRSAFLIQAEDQTHAPAKKGLKRVARCLLMDQSCRQLTKCYLRQHLISFICHQV